MPLAQHDIEYYLDTARDLANQVTADADRIDCERQIPSDLAGEMADKGLFRLLVPRSLGGAELSHLDFLRILKIFSKADGSTAWSLNQNNVFATASAIIPEQTAREIWGDGRAVVSNGPPTSSVKALPVDGGYRLSGRWNFSTGSPHATWLAALVPMAHPGDQQDSPTARASARIMLFPKENATILDTWQVNGLRGTGSFSFEVDDLYVPSARTYEPTDPPREGGPLYVIPRTLLFASGDATIALGIARTSLNTAIDIASTKTPGQFTNLLRDQSATQRLIGEGEAIWHSAQAFLDESASAVWKSACNRHAPPTKERIQLRLASTFAIRKAAEVVDICYNLCSSSAIFASNPLHRRFQDIHVITQHLQGRPTHYETAGQFFLGLDPGGSF